MMVMVVTAYGDDGNSGGAAVIDLPLQSARLSCRCMLLRRFLPWPSYCTSADRCIAQSASSTGMRLLKETTFAEATA